MSVSEREREILPDSIDTKLMEMPILGAMLITIVIKIYKQSLLFVHFPNYTVAGREAT